MKNLLLLSILSLLISCASIDLPPGGDRDTQAPRIVSSSPDSAETFFTGDQIKITFNEYFTLNNFNQSLIVSPPLASQPKTTIRGKSLLLQINEPLLPNTTYQFYFDDGIKDLNEGNPTKNLRLVFSTGPNIDTSFIGGEVHNAFSRLPEEGVKVLLYKEYSDSQLIKQLPYYITKTDKQGHFTFNNIGEEQYYIYALHDENNNNVLDITDRFAFLSNPIKSNTKENNLYISKTKNNQELCFLNYTERSSGQYIFFFNKPLNQSTISVKSTESFVDVSKNKTLPWHFGKTQDTLYIYNSSREISVHDSFEIVIALNDIDIKQKVTHTNEKSTNHKIYTDQNFNPNKSIKVQSDYGLLKINTLGFSLFDLTDSIHVSIDSIITEQNAFFVFGPWKEEHTYRITNNEKALYFHDQTAHPSDTLFTSSFSSQKTGQLEIDIVIDSTLDQKDTYIFCLTKNNAIFQTKKVQNNTQLQFSFLTPGEYSAYIFIDEDFNEIWTDGDYSKKRTPEAIWHLNSPIDIRSKWKTNGIRFTLK